MHDNKNKNRRSKNSERTEDVLPSSQILEKFEDAVPHSVEDLMDMAKVEQKHRHEWQSNFSKNHNLSFRLGQIFGLVYNLGLLYIIYDLVKAGKQDLAVTLFTINALLIGFAILATTIERKIFSRRPDRRSRNNRNDKRSPRNNSNGNRNNARNSSRR